MSRCLSLTTLCLALLMTLCATAQEAIPLPARLVDGKAFTGTLLRLDDKQAMFQSGGGERTVPLSDLLAWGSPAARRKRSYLLLADGSLVAGEITGVTAENVTLTSLRRPGLWKPSQISRKGIKAIVYQSSASPFERERFDAELLSATDSQDRLLMVDGDSLSGSLLDAVPADEGMPPMLRFLLAGSKEPLQIATDRIAAAVFANKAARPLAASGFWLSMADGSLVRADRIRETDETISLTLPSGSTLDAAAVDADVEPPETFWSRVTFLQPLSPQVTYLSDLPTIGFKHVPLLDWQQEYASDRCMTHSALRCGGQMFVKGIGMPATSRLAYDIPDGARRFEAEIGVDDDANNAGSVIFRVFLESPGQSWKPVFESKTLRGGDGPQSVRVELGEARRLALVVDMADHGDQRDYADWLNARFVK